MPEVDLTFAQQTLRETVLLDRCTVRRRLPGSEAAVFNEVTGDYEAVDAATVILATDEPCKIADEGEQPSGRAGKQHDEFKIVTFGFGVLDTIEMGDEIEVTTSRDPRLLGLFIVSEVIEATLRVSRRVRVIRRRDARHSAD